LDYFNTNIATFGIGITLRDTFICLYLWIIEHNNKLDLESRLLDELKEMKGYCTTGRLARLINVIQGYTEDENLMVRINDRDRTYSIVKTFLDKKLKECKNEEVLEGMIDLSEKYKEYIRFILSEIILEWKGNNENIDDIVESVNKYCGCEIFSTE
jgi:hypothetical protein